MKKKILPRISGSGMLATNLFKKSKDFIVWLCCDLDDGYIILAIFTGMAILFARNIPIWK
jgi:hypothetical protein